MTEPALLALLHEVETLNAAIRSEAAAAIARWEPTIERPGFRESAENLAHYLALRRRDIRPLQRRLMVRGLSSLGRLESRVAPSLEALAAALGGLAGAVPPRPWPEEARFFEGERRLAERTVELFGPPAPGRPVHLLVTCPSEAADSPDFMRRLAAAGVEALRINCAHDDADAWLRMIGHARAAGAEAGRPFRILMDLAGPKMRLGTVAEGHGRRLQTGDRFSLTVPGALDAADPALPAAECTLVEALRAAKPGERVFLDDGKLAAVVETVVPFGLVLRVALSPEEEGYKLKEAKGVNFPDTRFSIPALTAKDREDLAVVAAHADGIEFSFVQSAEDVAALQAALADIRPKDWTRLALVLKIETTRALANLPEMLVRAAGRQPTAVMIARGDLAVEIGFARLAEMQEELLWICEAAQVPVVWATQVLEHLIKKGLPSRGEMTDAAMAARAECVMLNKGPHLFAAIAELDTLLARMGEHQYKKSPRLRRLTSW
ncbi:pyruvate kinase [Prosthecomicrobium pneumaticum]|uniref:Pyruvate kinase n=1 Tax=Prosthecomicrobium pneumaticum TaxID=81895 RepID=A0A7W9L3B9_9HYPH|nr:pyruvate kinase [Prosthecomicrobium pneumaticum]MBB5754386.1 pyruvate kinase [Prosthecomicrobium pneumaticum]